MGLSAADRSRVRELAAELKDLVGGSRHADGRAKTFDELEEESIEVSDLLCEAMLGSLVDDTDEPSGTCRCPKCDRVCPRRHDDEPRVVEADRGTVTWNEAEYFCRRCRRSFFPS